MLSLAPMKLPFNEPTPHKDLTRYAVLFGLILWMRKFEVKRRKQVGRQIGFLRFLHFLLSVLDSNSETSDTRGRDPRECLAGVEDQLSSLAAGKSL